MSSLLSLLRRYYFLDLVYTNSTYFADYRKYFNFVADSCVKEQGEVSLVSQSLFTLNIDMSV